MNHPVMPVAQEHQIVEIGVPAVPPVQHVVAVNPQM
jgi:hypothetical protein